MTNPRTVTLSEIATFDATPIPGNLRKWARLLAGLLLMSTLVLLLAPWRQVASGQGQVVAYSPTQREQHLHAPISGRIVQWGVVEGTRVEKGDTIVELIDVDPEYEARLQSRRSAEQDRIDAARNQASVLEQQVEALTRSQELDVMAAKLKVKMADQKLIAEKQKSAAAQAESETAQANLERTEKLFERGLVSRRALELAELSFRKAEASRKLAEASVSEAEANRTALEAEVLKVQAEGGAKVAKAAAEREKASAEAAYARGDLAKVEVDISRQKSRTVSAPTSGVVVHIDGNEGGGIVKEGQHLAVLVPDTTSRAVELHVDGNDAPLVSIGRKVRLQFEGWPALQFVGWPSVAVGTFGGVVSFVDPASSDAEGRIRVLVVPDREQPPWPDSSVLRQRVQAKGWILLEEVTVGWELWRRINGFPPALSEGKSAKSTPSQPKGNTAGGTR